MGNEVTELTELLQKITVEVNFRPEGGAFRSTLADIAVAAGDEEFAELFSPGSADILVSISPQNMVDGIIPFLVSSDRGELSLACRLAELSAEARSDLGVQLSRTAAPPLAAAGQPQKVIVRKRTVTGMLDIRQAAELLSCSENFLKSRIPCSDYSYDEVDGKPVITGYYWSQQLIDRLLQSKAHGVRTEDLEYVAAECCHGDSKWAEEVLAALSRPLPKAKPAGGSAEAGAKKPGRPYHRFPRKKNS